MSPTAKSLTAAVAVLAATGTILAGAMMRDKVDVGGVNSAEAFPSMSGLVVSRDKREVPEGDYFYEISNLLKQRYVESVSDERKLAIGAIRGMVTSLGDPDSLFLDKDSFTVHRKMREGEYEGIGAQLEMIYLEPPTKDSRNPGQPVDPDEVLLSSIRIPKLTVVSVVPGGPADKAGVKVGDYVEYVDDHWIPNAETVASYRKLQADFSQKKITWEQLSKVRVELNQRMKKSLLPLKARERLLIGQTGEVNVVWKRGKESITTNIAKAPSRQATFAEVDGAIHLLFAEGVDAQLKEAIQGKTEIVIDLRNNANGLSGPMQKCLEVLVPKGAYGVLKVAKHELPLEVKVGNAQPPTVTLLADQSTRGAAEIFADALVKAGVAKSVGKTAGHRILVEDYALPDGSGYTLAIASYAGGAK